MASILVSPTDDLPKIVELAGGSLDMSNFRFEGQHLHVNDVTQEDLDAAWATYSSDLETYLLEPHRVSRKERISRLSAGFIDEIYPSFRRELFIALAEEARNSGLTNRAAYINQMLTWVKTVVASVLILEDEINAATTVEEIEAVNFDSTPFIATDPEITVRNALAIED